MLASKLYHFTFKWPQAARFNHGKENRLELRQDKNCSQNKDSYPLNFKKKQQLKLSTALQIQDKTKKQTCLPLKKNKPDFNCLISRNIKISSYVLLNTEYEDEQKSIAESPICPFGKFTFGNKYQETNVLRKCFFYSSTSLLNFKYITSAGKGLLLWDEHVSLMNINTLFIKSDPLRKRKSGRVQLRWNGIAQWWWMK